MAITQITHNIGNYIINTDMNITIDKEKKTITLHGAVSWTQLRQELLQLIPHECWDDWQIIPPPPQIQYIPIYPASPPVVYPPYPVQPYPYYIPCPSPLWYPYTLV